MKGQVNDVASASEICNLRATLLIPFGITVICSCFDMLFKIKLGMTEYVLLMEWTFWILGTLISYFFPSFLGASLTLWWQFYFADNWSGIRNDRGVLLGISNVLYFCLYVVYLLFSDSFFYTVAFVVLSIIYVTVIVCKCIDNRVFKKLYSVPGNCVVNTPH